MRTLREAGESRLVQIGIRGSVVTRRDGQLIARHAASQPESQSAAIEFSAFRQPPPAVTKSPCDFLENYPA